MKLEPIILRLKGVSAIKLLGGALEFAALDAAPRARPAAYVVPEDKTPTGNRFEGSVGAIDQKVVVSFRVVLVLDAAARKGAVGISDELDTLARAVVAELLGWTPPDCKGPILYAGERLMSVDGTALVWGLSFKTHYHLRKVG